MVESRCQQNSHDWICRQVSGDFNEKTVNRPIPTDKINALMQNNNLADTFCPGGVVLCNRCEETLPPGQNITKMGLPDIEAINKTLFKR